MSDSTPESTQVTTYAEIEAQVKEHFDGSWERFLKAVENPAEILHFVLVYEYDKDRSAFEAWAKDKALPPDWVPRFYSTLTAEGELSSSN